MCLWKDLAMTLHLWWRSGQFYSLLISQPSCHIRRKKKNRCIVQPLSFPSFLHSARLRYPRCCLKATWKPWWMIWPSCPSTGRPFLRITRLTWSDLGIQISRAVLGAPYIEPRWNQAFWIWTPTNKYYDVSWCFFQRFACTFRWRDRCTWGQLYVSGLVVGLLAVFVKFSLEQVSNMCSASITVRDIRDWSEPITASCHKREWNLSTTCRDLASRFAIWTHEIPKQHLVQNTRCLIYIDYIWGK